MTDTAPNDPAPNDATPPAPKDDAAKADTPPTPNTLPDPAVDFQAAATKWEKQAKNDAAALAALKKRMQGLLTPEQVQEKDEAVATTARERDDAKHEALRLRVALEESLPVDLADRLIGGTKEELVADAAKLKALLGTGTPKPRVPDAGAGTGKAPAPPEKDPNALLRLAAGIG